MTLPVRWLSVCAKLAFGLVRMESRSFRDMKRKSESGEDIFSSKDWRAKGVEVFAMMDVDDHVGGGILL